MLDNLNRHYTDHRVASGGSIISSFLARLRVEDRLMSRRQTLKLPKKGRPQRRPKSREENARGGREVLCHDSRELGFPHLGYSSCATGTLRVNCASLS